MTSQLNVTNQSRKAERGIALLFCIFALLILTAVTTSLIISSGTETSVNYNYRTEEASFFAAKSGLYEALDRMQQTNASSIASLVPTTLPSATGGVLYLINAGASLTVQPWTSTNTYFDREFCHEGFTIAGMTSAPPDIACTTVPTGSTWYATATSNYPLSGTAAAMPYQWVRVNWKQNSSQSYLTGGSTPVTARYSVDSTGAATTPACWNGASQVLLSTPMGVSPAYTRCEHYQSCGAVQPTIKTPVLMVTAMAITSNGSRQMVQAEAALNPPTVAITPCGISDPYGFFAYGSACITGTGAPFDLGGNAFVDGYNSANGGTYASTHSTTTGSIGSNGSVYVHGSSSNVGGKIYVQNPGPPPSYTGTCPTVQFGVAGNPTYGQVLASTPQTKPTVSIPSNASVTNVSSGTIAPGSYNNLSVGSHGSVILTAPGTYTFNCISMGSFGTLSISPATKAVTINLTGTGCASTPLSMNSHATLNNSSQVASNLQINYAGTGTITMEGGPSMFCVLNAPNSAVVLHGGADYYGTILANTIDDSGGTNLHFDAADTTISGQAATTATATATGSYNILSYRSLPY